MTIRKAMMSLAALSLIATPAVAQSGQLRGVSATLAKPVGKRLGGQTVQPAGETVTDSSELFLGLPLLLLVVGAAVAAVVAITVALEKSSPN